MTTLPNTWREASLDAVTLPDAPIGYGIVQVGPFDRGGVPVIAIRDLPTPKAGAVHRSARNVEAQYRRSRVRPGDVLISVKGTTGRIGLVPEGFEGNISRDVARVRLRPEHDPRYWLQLLRSNEAQQTLQLAAVGTTRQELSIGTLKSLVFRYPSRSEQSRIADILTDFDQQISSAAQLIAKHRDAKAAAAHHLLSLDADGMTYVRVPLGDIATVDKGDQLGRADMDPMGTVPVWNGGIAPSGYTNAPNVVDRVVTISEGGNSCGWVGRPAGPFWLGGHCYAVRPRRPDLPMAFLYQVLKFHEAQIMALRVGSGLPNIQKARLKAFAIEAPISEQDANRVAQILDNLDEQIATAETRVQKLMDVKQGVLQRLLDRDGSTLEERAS